jgi:hypothetical protein
MRILFCLTIVIAFGCQRQAREDSSIEANAKIDSLKKVDLGTIEFSDYVNRLPQINLPFKFSCDSGLVWPKIDYENEVIKKFKPEGAGIIGKVYQSEKSVGILYTYPADIMFPIIQIFDLRGQELRRIELFEEGNCMPDENYSAVTRGQITSDLQLISWIEIINCDEGKKCDTTRSNLRRVVNE